MLPTERLTQVDLFLCLPLEPWMCGAALKLLPERGISARKWKGSTKKVCSWITFSFSHHHPSSTGFMLKWALICPFIPVCCHLIPWTVIHLLFLCLWYPRSKVTCLIQMKQRINLSWLAFAVSWFISDFPILLSPDIFRNQQLLKEYKDFWGNTKVSP